METRIRVFFNPSADVFGISAGGTERLTVSGVGDSTDGVGINGNLTVTGTVAARAGAFENSLTVSGIPVDITGGGGSSLTVKETDGSPTVDNVTTIVVTTGTLTDDGGGQVTINTGGGGGGSSAFSGAQATLSGANQTISDGIATFLEFDRELFDTDGWFTTSSGQVMTVPAGLGITHVRVSAQVFWDGDATPSADGRRDMKIQKNYQTLPAGSAQIRLPTDQNQIVIHQVHSAPIPVVDGDEFAIEVIHNTGGALDVGTSQQRTWIAIEAL